MKHRYDWAAETGRFSATRRNPMDMVPKPKKNRSRERFLTHAEIRRVWQACDDWEAETLAFAEKGESRAPGGFDLLTDYPRAVKLASPSQGMRSTEIGGPIGRKSRCLTQTRTTWAKSTSTPTGLKRSA